MLSVMRSVYRIGEFAEKIGHLVSTAPRREAEGRISVRRSPSGQRFFTDADVAVQDLLAVMHTFSGRLDGLRRYEKHLTPADLGREPS